MLDKIRKFLENLRRERKIERKAKELYLKAEDLTAEEYKELYEKAKVLEIARLMRENMLQRREIEKLKEQIKALNEKLKKKYREEEKAEIEKYKKLKAMRETSLFICSNPPISVLPFDKKYPFPAPDGSPSRFLCGFKLVHDSSGGEPLVYPILGTAPLRKISLPKNIYRIILPDRISRFSRMNEMIAEPDILVYALRYGVPITLKISDAVVERTKSENSVRIFLPYQKGIKVCDINGKPFEGKSGKKLPYLVGLELADSRYKEPLLYPLVSDEPIKIKMKKKAYEALSVLQLKESHLSLSELFTLFLERERLISDIKAGKPVKISVTYDGIFVKDYLSD